MVLPLLIIAGLLIAGFSITTDPTLSQSFFGTKNASSISPTEYSKDSFERTFDKTFSSADLRGRALQNYSRVKITEIREMCQRFGGKFVFSSGQIACVDFFSPIDVCTDVRIQEALNRCSQMGGKPFCGKSTVSCQLT